MWDNYLPQSRRHRRMLSSLVIASAVSVCISGGNIWANGSIVNKEYDEYSTDMTITADQKLSSDNNAIVGVANGIQNGCSKIQMTNGAKLTVNSSANERRAYGLAVNSGADLLLVGNAEFNTVGIGNTQAHTIRNNGGGRLTLDGDITINTTAGSAFSVAVESWDSADKQAITEFKGSNTAINITGDKVQANAVQVVSKNNTGAIVDFGADNTVITNAATAQSYAVLANNGEAITLGSLGKTVNLEASASNGASGQLAAIGAYALNGGQITINGALANIDVNIDKSGRAMGVRVEGKDADTLSNITLNSDTTNIRVNGNTNVGSFNEGAWVKNGTLAVNSKNLNITGAISGYTLEGMNVSTNGLIELNTEKTLINIQDDYGVTGVTAHNGGTFKVNQGDLIIVSTNTAANGVGKTNSIGMMSDEIVGAESQNSIIIGSAVGKVDITVNGAGQEGSTPNASNGTAGIYNVDGKIDINSKALNVKIQSGDKIAAGQVNAYSNATGIKGLNGEITVGAATSTNISVHDYYQKAVGVYAGQHDGKTAKINVLGDTSIEAQGKTDSYALYAEEGGHIAVGSLGKTVNLTGEVYSNESSISLVGNTTIKGQLESIIYTGTGNFNTDGDYLQIENQQTDNSASGVYVRNGGRSTGSNTLIFNSTNSSIKAFSNYYAFGIDVNTNSQNSGNSTNEITFNGNKLYIEATSTQAKAHGIHLAHSDFGGKLDTNLTFNSNLTELNVYGTATGYYNQVAGVWEGEGFFSEDTKTKVVFAKDAKINVVSDQDNVYGIYLKGSGGSTVIDFVGNTDIAAYNYTQEAGTAVYVSGDNRRVNIGSLGKTVSLTGDVVATDSGTISLGGDSNIVRGTLTADNGVIILNGGDKAVYSADKFVTKKNGTMEISGGKLNIDDLHNNIGADNKYNLQDGSLIVTNKGVLEGFAQNLFDNTPDNKLAIYADISKVIRFSSGKLAVADATYSLSDSKTYAEALKAATIAGGDSAIIMTGTLQDQISNAGIEDLGNTGAIHTQISATTSANDITIGASQGSIGSINNDFGAKDLYMGDNNADSTIAITSGKALTLVGDGSGNLIKTASGEDKTSNVQLSIGDVSAGGNLHLGTAAANSGGVLNAAVSVDHNDSQLSVDSGNFAINEIKANQGSVIVSNGATLTTGSLSVGDTAGSKSANLTVTGSLAADSFTASADSKIIVGNEGSAGTLVAENVNLNGAAIVLDPVWDGSQDIANASKAGLAFTNNDINGKLTVGRNSILTIGSKDTSKAEATFAKSKLTWGENNISAALYLDAPQNLATTGGIYVDGTQTGAAAVANQANFAKGSLLMIDSSSAAGANVALTGSNSTLQVNSGASLYIANAEAGKTYSIVSGFDNNNSNVSGWQGNELLLNKLVKGKVNFNNGSFTVTTTAVQAGTALPGVYLPNILDTMSADTGSAYEGIKYLSNAITDLNNTGGAVNAVNNFAARAERVGASHSSIMATMTMSNSVQDYFSLADSEGDSAKDGVWAEYTHTKENVSNMGGATYDSQYNGIIVGVGFKPQGKYHSGIAFSYGDGSSTDAVGNNKYSSWGVSYYGSIRNDTSNLIFDIGYSKTDHDIKGVVNTEPSSKIITMGIKGEKLYNNGHGTKYVPHVGLRYLNISNGSYDGKINGQVAVNYNSNSANIWMLPVGISISHESSTSSGWKFRPYADISYVFVMGDKNNNMTVTVPGVNASDVVGYQLMDSGFFSGKLGLEAKHKNITYGIGYSYQKSSNTKNNKFFMNLEFKF